MHLATAVENAFDEPFVNDRHLPAATPQFGLQGNTLINTTA